MLKIDLRPGQSITIGDAIVTLEAKSGQLARLSVVADKSIPVRRMPEPEPAQGSLAQMVAREGITRKA